MKKIFSFGLVLNTIVIGLGCLRAGATEEVLEVGGIYPHLTVSNNENECGTGAVVPWADRLWVITYAPHMPKGSSDKLYEINPKLEVETYPGSVGGTPANRMIHRETEQLLIGPYLIDTDRKVRTITSEQMMGRLTGNARHLQEPESKVYYATMEEGLYEVDVETLEVTNLIEDGHVKKPTGVTSKLPGYHGKGLYSGQGSVFYSNNGEKSDAARKDPTTPSGALARWSEVGQDWELIRRDQFTELTGPGGIYGAENPESDPIWGMGWDAKSILLALIEEGEPQYFRMPKGSHSYDGAHGWNTEWPRIREIGEGDDFLATMHGTFWNFPATFSSGDTSGIRPRSNYLKVIGDFCWWGDRIVFGCDDSAKSEFLNTRPFKAEHAAALQSHSNLWFVAPERLDQLGPVIGRGAVWMDEAVKAGQVSDPFLVAGYDHRLLTLASADAASLKIEVDGAGNGEWENYAELSLEAGKPVFHSLPEDLKAEWVRIVSTDAASGMTAHFNLRDRDERGSDEGDIFAGIDQVGGEGASSRALLRSLSDDRLGLVVIGENGEEDGFYELDHDLVSQPSDDAAGLKKTLTAAQPVGAYSIDSGSLLFEEDGKRYRLPLAVNVDGESTLTPRVCREVATERDLLNVGGTVYELPARNAGGLAKLRPVASHGLEIYDFCSHAGLLFLTGIEDGAESARIFRSEDGKAAVWAGVIDELWELGKPRGEGGPWLDTSVRAGGPSDPYLMTGYDEKTIRLSAEDAVEITIEVDIHGTDHWLPYEVISVSGGETVVHRFPEGFSAYWVRVTSSGDTVATATLIYQ